MCLGVFTRDNYSSIKPLFFRKFDSCGRTLGLKLPNRSTYDIKKFYIIWLHSAIYRVDNTACGRAWVCLQETTTLAY